MSAMNDPNNSIYRLQVGRSHHQGEGLTPHSAVSSFNLPAAYDSNLITPVSMNASPTLIAKPEPPSRRDGDINLSPAVISPTSYQLGWEGDQYSPGYSQHQMKFKDNSRTLHVQTPESMFPPSPSYGIPPHYHTQYSVQTPLSARNSDSSSSMLQSPHLHPQSGYMSAGGLSTNSQSSSNHSVQNSHMFRPSNVAPILIAPNPLNRRTSTSSAKQDYGAPIKQEYGVPRHDSISSTQSAPCSQGPTQGAFTGEGDAQASRNKKRQRRKDPPSAAFEALVASSDLNEQERLLLKLTVRTEHLQWKEVAKTWNAAFRQQKSVAALQMRKKRLMEKLRNSATDMPMEDYTNPKHDLKWDIVNNDMRKHGAHETWAKHDAETYFNSSYDMPPRKRSRSSSFTSPSHSSWSDNQSMAITAEDGETTVLASALSTASMDDVRDRAEAGAVAAVFQQRRASTEQMMQDRAQQERLNNHQDQQRRLGDSLHSPLMQHQHHQHQQQRQAQYDQDQENQRYADSIYEHQHQQHAWGPGP